MDIIILFRAFYKLKKLLDTDGPIPTVTTAVTRTNVFKYKECCYFRYKPP